MAATWQEQRHRPILGGANVKVTGQPQVGSILAVAPHPTNQDIIWVAGVNGGIWKTTNATTTTPTKPNTFYATVYGGAAGNGIYTSDDSGATWTNITGTIAGIRASTNNLRVSVHSNAGITAIYVGILTYSPTVRAR